MLNIKHFYVFKCIDKNKCKIVIIYKKGFVPIELLNSFFFHQSNCYVTRKKYALVICLNNIQC